MTLHARFIYSKRGGACFVPHVALAQIFSRSASRAGLRLTMTQGFSPRAKLSFGPELPAGVVALNEPVDMFFESCNSDALITFMNNSLPEGFNISRVIFPDENSPSLGKLCKYAEYLLRLENNINLIEHVHDFYGDYILHADYNNNWLKIVLRDPAQNGIGGLVRYMTGKNIITGWQNINIVRTSIGHYESEKGNVYL